MTATISAQPTGMATAFNPSALSDILMQQLAVLSLIDWLALAVFFFFWVGYTYYAQSQIGVRPCLAGEMRLQRALWMKSLLQRENRIADVSIIANVERYVMFYTSTSVLVLAGLLAALTNSDGISDLAKQIPLLAHNSPFEWTMKILLAMGIFVYVFFKLTWSIREYGFASVLIGSAPLVTDKDSDKARADFAKGMAHLLDRASTDFNASIRAYYFAMTIIVWMFSPVLFMVASWLVVGILYRREFSSDSLAALVELRGQVLET